MSGSQYSDWLRARELGFCGFCSWLVLDCLSVPFQTGFEAHPVSYPAIFGIKWSVFQAASKHVLDRKWHGVEVSTNASGGPEFECRFADRL